MIQLYSSHGVLKQWGNLKIIKIWFFADICNSFWCILVWVKLGWRDILKFICSVTLVGISPFWAIWCWCTFWDCKFTVEIKVTIFSWLIILILNINLLQMFFVGPTYFRLIFNWTWNSGLRLENLMTMNYMRYVWISVKYFHMTVARCLPPPLISTKFIIFHVRWRRKILAITFLPGIKLLPKANCPVLSPSKNVSPPYFWAWYMLHTVQQRN